MDISDPSLYSVHCPGGGKIAYGTRSDALTEKRRLDRICLKKRGRPDANLRVYECPKCYLWHVGHDRQRSRR